MSDSRSRMNFCRISLWKAGESMSITSRCLGLSVLIITQDLYNVFLLQKIKKWLSSLGTSLDYRLTIVIRSAICFLKSSSTGQEDSSAPAAICRIIAASSPGVALGASPAGSRQGCGSSSPRSRSPGVYPSLSDNSLVIGNPCCGEDLRKGRHCLWSTLLIKIPSFCDTFV